MNTFCKILVIIIIKHILFFAYISMKKSLVFLLVFFLLSWNVWAKDISDDLVKIPDGFEKNCYKNYTTLKATDIWDSKNPEKSVILNMQDTQDLVLSQRGYILPYQRLNSINQDYLYTTLSGDRPVELYDNNQNTFLELDTLASSSRIFVLPELLTAKSFQFSFNYDSDYYRLQIFTSTDNTNYSLVTRNNISDFDTKYIKISFTPYQRNPVREKIKLYELNLSPITNSLVTKSFYNDDIEIYSQYDCVVRKYSINAKSYPKIGTDINTLKIQVPLENNPLYNPSASKDSDYDSILDTQDNCINNFNPLQKDHDSNGVWDVCSDVDADGKLWYLDNCPYTKNTDQKDINNNKVWDACEFDKDKDGIFDSFDNCITLPNKDQTDSDKDGIWNSCDNCNLYNPKQKDTNNNTIWDVCEQQKIFEVKNDEDEDGILNNKDNCKNIKNTDQIDTDKDGIGDVCDNCKNIDNKNQIDLDKNNIWDMCEDSDGDSVLGYLDNCISITNNDQNDKDNNGIWDVCEDSDNDQILFAYDNCPHTYNPDQKDIDQDNTGDLCDSEDNRFIESNKWFFIWLMILIVIIFSIGIGLTLKKLQNNS